MIHEVLPTGLLYRVGSSVLNSVTVALRELPSPPSGVRTWQILYKPLAHYVLVLRRLF